MQSRAGPCGSKVVNIVLEGRVVTKLDLRKEGEIKKGRKNQKREESRAVKKTDSRDLERK